MFISHMLFKCIDPGKLRAALLTLMFLESEVMFALYVIEKVTLFAEALRALVAFVCFMGCRSIGFIKPQAYLILNSRTIVNGTNFTFDRIWDR